MPATPHWLHMCLRSKWPLTTSAVAHNQATHQTDTTSYTPRRNHMQTRPDPHLARQPQHGSAVPPLACIHPLKLLLLGRLQGLRQRLHTVHLTLPDGCSPVLQGFPHAAEVGQVAVATQALHVPPDTVHHGPVEHAPQAGLVPLHMLQEGAQRQVAHLHTTRSVTQHVVPVMKAGICTGVGDCIASCQAASMATATAGMGERVWSECGSLAHGCCTELCTTLTGAVLAGHQHAC